MKNTFYLTVLLSLLLASCTKHLFDKEYMKGVIIATPVKPGEFGQIEMHLGKHIEDSYLTLYQNESIHVHGNNFPDIGDSVYFKVKDVKGIPVAHSFAEEKPASIYRKTPITRLNAHSFEKEGRNPGWHRVGHMVINSIETNQNGTKFSIRFDNGEIKPYSLNQNLIPMAVAIDTSETAIIQNTLVSKFKIFYNVENNTVTALDTFHRHGSSIVDTGGRPYPK